MLDGEVEEVGARDQVKVQDHEIPREGQMEDKDGSVTCISQILVLVWCQCYLPVLVQKRIGTNQDICFDYA